MHYAWVQLVVMGTLLGITGPAAAVDVTFPDANLETAVRGALGIAAPTPITDTNMETLGSFDANDSSISNIQGLEYATNLTWLSLYGNQISDISAVAGLTNLNYLFLEQNQISDISAVSGLTNLTWLYLYSNQISDISTVAGLTNLNWLYLYNNQISDISTVSGLTNLYYLQLDNNQISDISAVAGLTNLNYLFLDNNQISDISAVAGLTNLTRLHVSGNQIETMNLSNSNLSSLNYFLVDGNPLTSVILADATLGQTGFNALMDGGDIPYIGIAELPGVLNLDMSGVDFTGISDLSTMYGLDDLEELLLAEATNLGGSQVVPLSVELDSLNLLSVVGLWDSFDAGTQSSLGAWDAIVGNTLVTASIPGDANHDGTVDEDDAAILAANWQTLTSATWRMGDFNGDYAVNNIDATLLAANWQSGASSAVPEPCALFTVFTGLFLLLLCGYPRGRL